MGEALAAFLTANAGLPFVDPGVISVPAADSPAVPAVEGTATDGGPDLLGVWMATVESRWYRDYVGNPFSSTPDAPTQGFVTIEYKLINTSLPTMPAGKDLVFMSIGLGKAFDQLSAGYRPDGEVPDLVGMGGDGLSLNWVWGAGGLSKGEASATLIVHTGFRSTPIIGNVAVVGGGSAQSFSVFVPVPEPSTYAGLFALGLAGFAAYRRLRA